MIQYIKNNFPIIVLLMIVIGGFGYPFYSGKWIVAPKLNEIDAKCYGIMFQMISSMDDLSTFVHV